MPTTLLFTFGLIALIAWAWVCRWLLDNPRGDFEAGVVYRFLQVYARLVHRLRVVGRQHIRELPAGRPVVIVANHTSGIDPILIQAACPFEVRWLMAEDMRHPWGEWFWGWADVIFVDRTSGESMGTREALRHLKQGGVLGVFPEGGIERPPRRIMPFRRGVGMIVKRSGAVILPVIIEGTPQIDPAWHSLRRFSRSRLTILPSIDFADSTLSADEITSRLRQVFLDQTGWPPNDVPDPEIIHGPSAARSQPARPPTGAPTARNGQRRSQTDPGAAATARSGTIRTPSVRAS